MPVERAAGDTVAERRVFAGGALSVPLALQVLSFSPGRSKDRAPGTSDEILFVVSGVGTVVVSGEPQAVGPETGLYVPAGGTWRVENPGPDDLVVVSWHVLNPIPPIDGAKCVVVLDEQDQVGATAERQFRYVVNRAAGCRSATQFVGYVPPGRAPEHYHAYNELAYILEGAGTVHIDGGSYPFSEGYCLAFPAKVVHSLENTTASTLRILGVFVPAGSPAEAYYPDGTLTFEYDSFY